MTELQHPISWKNTLRNIQNQVEAIWTSMPVDVQKVSWGVIDSGAGSGKQSLSIYVHLQAYCMLYGSAVFYRLLRLANRTDSDEIKYDLKKLIKLTRAFVHETFDAFEFMGDMGYVDLKKYGEEYVNALEDLSNVNEYLELTKAMMTLMVRYHRWTHSIFPWSLGAAFPHRTKKDIDYIQSILSSNKSIKNINYIENKSEFNQTDIQYDVDDFDTILKDIRTETNEIWTTEPEDITKVRWGIVKAGSGDQSWSVMVYLEAYLMLVGADLFYRFLLLNEDPEFDVKQAIDITLEFLKETFNQFEFLGDLGLVKLSRLGERYINIIKDVKTKQEYHDLTAAMMTLVVRHHRWIHFYFGWNLGGAYPHVTRDHIKLMYDTLFPTPPEPPPPPPPSIPSERAAMPKVRRVIYSG